MRAIGGRSQSAKYTWRDYLSYIREITFPSLTRSLGAVTAAVAVLLGGWVTTVDAANSSLPGDALYGFKLVTEQVQLRLSSAERRAVLHTEFAERRLEEVTALQVAGPSADAQVKVAVDGFTREIASANQELRVLVESGSAQALATASAVEGRLSAFDAVLDEAVAVSSDTEMTTYVQDAKDAARETQSTAVAVVVDSHEEQGDDATERELQDMFQRELGDLRGRQTFDLHRLEVVQSSLVVHTDKLAGVTAPTPSDFAIFTATVKEADKNITAAMDTFALGGYREAFEKLRSIDGDLLAVESRLAQAEIAIVTALSNPVVINPEPTVQVIPETVTTPVTPEISN